jgi:Carboxypeptidase regulatory-like domain
MNSNTKIYILQGLLVLGLTQLAPGNPPPGATMHGIVTDPSGAVIPNATVLVAGPNYRQSLTTDERGNFVVAGLPAGEYRVRIQSRGFAPFFKSGLVATPGYETEADAQLNIGQTRQEITVTE